MRRRSFGATLVALSLAACATSPPQPAQPPPSSPRPSAPALLPLSALPGWSTEDHAADFAALQAGCGVSRNPRLARVCAEARSRGELTEAEARGFFEARFVAEAPPDSGLLTAYYTPVYPARRAPDALFSAPLRPRPDDLAAVQPYPDRAAIESRPPQRALAWMRPEDLFFLQVQGSGVLTFEDGFQAKAVYAANNGRPYVAIGKVMRDRGLLAPGEASAAAIHAWLAAHRGPEAQALMQLDPRYAFFSLAPADGRPPPGAAGLPLPARRAVAVDPAQHAYGETLWIDADQPRLAGARPRYTGFVLALDTGGAIQGAGRADLYLGEGPGPGAEASLVSHSLRLYRLVPKEPAA